MSTAVDSKAEKEASDYEAELIKLLVKRIDPATWQLIKICEEKLGLQLRFKKN